MFVLMYKMHTAVATRIRRLLQTRCGREHFWEGVIDPLADRGVRLPTRVRRRHVLQHLVAAEVQVGVR